jgi:uncharacterized SAM-binding protein YcdF (DUF218 family)
MKKKILIVLGKGIDVYQGKTVKMRIESKFNAIAAGMQFQKEDYSIILYSTGHTAGQEFPSESEVMCQYMLNKFNDISPSQIRMELESIDTVENITCIAKMVEPNWQIDVLSVDAHLKRVKLLFKKLANIDINPIAAESVMYENKRYRKVLSNYKKKGRATVELIKEFILRNLLIIDPKGQLLRKVTERQRYRK